MNNTVMVTLDPHPLLPEHDDIKTFTG